MPSPTSPSWTFPFNKPFIKYFYLCIISLVFFSAPLALSSPSLLLASGTGLEGIEVLSATTTVPDIAPVSTTTRILSYVIEAAQKAQIASSTLVILPKVIECESGFNPTAININKAHYRKDGTFVGTTTDYGTFQLNSVHIPEAKAMGLDITDWQDNIKYGVYLLKAQGLSPWRFSEFCWNPSGLPLD